MKNKYFDQIEQYISKELPADERAAFEAELSKNEALQQEMEVHQVAQATLERLVESDLRSAFSSWENQIYGRSRI